MLYLASAVLAFQNTKLGKVRVPYITILIGNPILFTCCCRMKNNDVDHTC